MKDFEFKQNDNGNINFTINKLIDDPGKYLENLAADLGINVNLDAAKGFHDLFNVEEGEEFSPVEGSFTSSEYVSIEDAIELNDDTDSDPSKKKVESDLIIDAIQDPMA